MRGRQKSSLLLGGLVTLLLAASPSTALAISAPIQISGTDGEGVFIRAEPNTSSTRLGWMPEGASPDYNCFVWGQDINGVPIWFNVNWAGITGYYASYYDNSSYHSNEELTAKYGVPLCGAAPPSEPPPPPTSTPEPTPSPSPSPEEGVSGSSGGPPSGPSAPSGVPFNRGATVAWATHHARDTPPYPASCTWFVSQALWAGGLPKTAAWTSAGGHGHFWSHRPGSVDAWAVPNFIQYILSTYPRSTFTQLNLRGNRVPAAQPGDVIAYDWYGHSSVHNLSHLQHVSLVVGIASGEYPEVSEWSVDEGREPTPYVSRGWTWSEKTHKWLQQEYPHVQAFLLHIDTSG